MENKLFDEMYKVENEHWWFVARRKIIDNVLRKLNLGNALNILDVGCGNGDNLTILSHYGEVVALERENEVLKRAQARNIGHVFKGELPDGIPDDIKKDKDLIVMLDVLEHIDDDVGTIRVLKEWIRKNGTLLITVPAYQFLYGTHDKLHHHKRRYTVTQLKEVIETNGWKVQYISYFNTFLFPLALLDRLKDKVLKPSNSIELKMPNKYLYIFLEKIFSLETAIVGRFQFPFGLSIIVIAKKT